MRKTKLLLASFLGLIVAGCQNGNQGQTQIHNLSADDAARMNSGHNSSADAVKDVPFTAETRFAAGQLAEAQGDPDTAIAQYQEALKLNPKHTPSLYRLSMIYTQNKKFPEAIESWNKYADATGGSADGYSNLGFCQELAGDPGHAEAAYKKGIAKDPKNVPCNVNYGLMLARRGKINEALLRWQTVLTPAETHYNLGSVYEMEGRKEQAKLEYNKALEMDPKLNDARSRMASLDQD